MGITMHSRYQRGFSLVELMVAMTILLFVLAIGSMAYGQYRDFWQVRTSHFESEFEDAKRSSILLSVLSNIQPHIVKDDTENAFHYFEGAETVVRSVVATSMKDEKQIAAFELYLRSDPDEGNKIFYREQLFTDSPFLIDTQLGKYDEPIELLSGVTEFSFEFFGFTHANDWYHAQDSRIKGLEKWFGAYSGKDTEIIPSKIKISFNKDGKRSELLVPLRHFSSDQHEFYSNHEN